MLLFEDIGFDLLPKIPSTHHSSLEIRPIEKPRPMVPTIMHTPVPSPNQIPFIKGSNTFRWFLFGLLLLGTLGATIYMANKEIYRDEES